MPRLFVALEASDEARARLLGLCQGVAAARWVRAPQRHLTLRFLGGVSDARATEATAALAEVVHPRFPLALAGVGVFPPRLTRKPPRVLWAGVDNLAALTTLKAAIDDRLGRDDEQAARGFHPHFTLARFTGRVGADLDRFLRHRQPVLPRGCPWAVSPQQSPEEGR